MTTDSHIIIQDASLRFRTYRNPTPNLKETVVDKLTKKNYNAGPTEFDALKNINLEIRPGDRLGILGLNGAGKSTLLKMIVGIYPPQAGQVSVRGKITPMIELGTGFDAELSGRENIYLNGTLIGRSYKQMKQLEEQIIEFSELGNKIDMPIKYYSSGMHARLAFSIGAIADPEILIMDEIFAAGDAQFVGKSLNRLHQMFDKAHILILVSHSEKHILNICNRAIVLNKGELVMQGSTVECVDHYMTEIVQDPTWTGSEQWIVNPLSFKDRKIIEQLSAGNSAELSQASDVDESNGIPEANPSELELQPAAAAIQQNDIISSGPHVSLGAGWYTAETYDESVFRWARNNAEILLPELDELGCSKQIVIDVEAGPALGRTNFILKFATPDDVVIAQELVDGRQKVRFVPPQEFAGKILRLQVDSNSVPAPGDERVLNFRVFSIRVRPQPPQEVASQEEPQPAQEDFAPPVPKAAAAR